eukprot:2373972-Ditylum_brightwellii.AAC.1
MGADIVNIPDNNNVPCNLFHQYGLLTIQNIIDHTVTTFIGIQNCAAQNNRQLYQCLENSVSQKTREMIVEEIGQYHLAGERVGALYFKHLANKTVVDTAIASSHLCHNLMHLPEYMLTINSNISKFNKYVRVNRQSLLAHGEQVDNLIHNLFSGYAVAQDCKFREYIAKKKESFEEGTVMTPDELMTYAFNYYNTRCDRKEWGQKAAEEQIVALTSTIKELCDANIKLDKSLATLKKGQKDTSKEKKSDTQADVKMPKVSDIKSDTPVYGWMVMPPLPNSPLIKEVKGLTYYWCKYHKAWVCHTKDQCRKKPPKKNKPKGNKKKDKSNNDNNANQCRLLFACTFAAIMADAARAGSLTAKH